MFRFTKPWKCFIEQRSFTWDTKWITYQFFIVAASVVPKAVQWPRFAYMWKQNAGECIKIGSASLFIIVRYYFFFYCALNATWNDWPLLFVSSCRVCINVWIINQEGQNKKTYILESNIKTKSYTKNWLQNNKTRWFTEQFNRKQRRRRHILRSTMGQLYPCPWQVSYFVNPELNYDLYLEDDWSDQGKKF